jgi:hypothetical protein
MTLTTSTRSTTTRSTPHGQGGSRSTAVSSRAVGTRAGGVSAASRQPRLPAPTPSRPISQAARDLLADAGRGLGRAIRADQPTERYAAAHLAALRGAAAILATKARPGRTRQASAWELLTKLAPEFGEWAAFFAAGSAKRQAAEAGISRFVSPREADDMVRQCAVFLDLVEAAL